MAGEFLRINGANVNATLFGVTILWYVLSIFGLLPVTMFQLHRLRQRFKKDGGGGSISSPSKTLAAENRRYEFVGASRLKPVRKLHRCMTFIRVFFVLLSKKKAGLVRSSGIRNSARLSVRGLAAVL